MSSPFGLVATGGELVAGGLSTWKIADPATAVYYSFGDLREANVSLKSIDSQNSQLQPQAHAFALEATAKMMMTDKAAVLQKLDKISRTYFAQKIAAIGSSKTYKGDWGLEWELVMEGGFDAYRYIQLMAKRKYVIQDSSEPDWDDLFSAPPADGAQSGADTTLTGFAPASYISSGFKKVELRAVGETNWEDVGPFKNGKLRAKVQASDDQFSRNLSYDSVKISLEGELQAVSTNLGLMDSVMRGLTPVDFRMTGADGTLFTYSDNLGVQIDFGTKDNPDDNQTIKVMGQGNISLSAFIASIS